MAKSVRLLVLPDDYDFYITVTGSYVVVAQRRYRVVREHGYAVYDMVHDSLYDEL